MVRKLITLALLVAVTVPVWFAAFAYNGVAEQMEGCGRLMDQGSSRGDASI